MLSFSTSFYILLYHAFIIVCLSTAAEPEKNVALENERIVHLRVLFIVKYYAYIHSYMLSSDKPTWSSCILQLWNQKGITMHYFLVFNRKKIRLAEDVYYAHTLLLCFFLEKCPFEFEQSRHTIHECKNTHKTHGFSVKLTQLLNANAGSFPAESQFLNFFFLSRSKIM